MSKGRDKGAMLKGVRERKKETQVKEKGNKSAIGRKQKRGEIQMTPLPDPFSPPLPFPLFYSFPNIFFSFLCKYFNEESKNECVF